MTDDTGAAVADDTSAETEPMAGAPAPPTRPELDPDDPLTYVRTGVEAALTALPSRFSFNNPVSGIDAADLPALNSLMGAGIEGEVVRTLNGLREVWDPEKRFSDYSFERSSQAFPDVRLVKREGTSIVPILGIELKGWYLFAKEGVPSLRYQVSPNACAPHDMVCVVPWYLSNAVSGTPEVTQPWVESARYAAEYRDYWWQHVREAKSDSSVVYPEGAKPYPSKADLVSAKPASDSGGNYGRLPRCRPLMDAFINSSMAFQVLGIPTSSWVMFLKLHKEQALPEEIKARLESQLNGKRAVREQSAEAIVSLVEQIAENYGAVS